MARGEASCVDASAAYLDVVGDLERMNTLLCALARPAAGPDTFLQDPPPRGLLEDYPPVDKPTPARGRTVPGPAMRRAAAPMLEK
jgi:hypothetical protein